MKPNHPLTSAIVALFFCCSLNANAASEEPEELNPFDPKVEEILDNFDKVYEEETGLSAHLPNDDFISDIMGLAKCYRGECAVWVQVVKATQTLYLYLNGQLSTAWPVSSGIAGYGTPNFDKNPDGRIYDRYSSTKYPGGDYNGLGNMPYAVFIQGGFALHGTPQSNWAKLGKPASHGCIRMHPDNGYYFNRLVRGNGTSQVWITVQ